MKLISMTDYVLGKFKEWENDNNSDCQSSARYILGTKAYAKFLKLPLKLGMFIPFDENDMPLDEPTPETSENTIHYELRIMEYKQAKERVIFESFEYEIGKLNGETAIWINKFGGLTISDIKKMFVEDLVKYNLTITDSAIKKYNL